MLAVMPGPAAYRGRIAAPESAAIGSDDLVRVGLQLPLTRWRSLIDDDPVTGDEDNPNGRVRVHLQPLERRRPAQRPSGRGVSDEAGRAARSPPEPGPGSRVGATHRSCQNRIGPGPDSAPPPDSQPPARACHGTKDRS